MVRTAPTRSVPHEAADLGHPGPDLPAHGDAVAVRQPDVQHGHIGPQGRDPGQRGRGGTGLADHDDVGFGGQHIPHPTPDDLMIIEQEDRDLRPGFAGLAHRTRLTPVG
jgi:hypothetical protein